MRTILLFTITLIFGVSLVAMDGNSRFAVQKNLLIEEIERDKQKLSEITLETGKRVKAIMSDLDNHGDLGEISEEISDIFCFKLFIATYGLSLNSDSAEKSIYKSYREFYKQKIHNNKKELEIVKITEYSDQLSDRMYEVIDSLERLKKDVVFDAVLKIEWFVDYLARACSVNYRNELTKYEIDCAIKRKDGPYEEFLCKKFGLFVEDQVRSLRAMESKLSENSLDRGLQDFIAHRLQYLEADLLKIQ